MLRGTKYFGQIGVLERATYFSGFERTDIALILYVPNKDATS